MATTTEPRTRSHARAKPSPAAARAAIYTRISNDPGGERAGVERQRAECLTLAERQGWTVVGTYEDNDRSAYSGKPRPAFERLLADAADGVFDVVVVWASDRLYRLMRDLVRIADELAPHARVVTVVTNGDDIDLTSSEGILRSQVLGSVAEFESRRKAERVAARAVQRATVERTMTASRRPFGWSWTDPCPGGAGCTHARTCTAPGQRPRQGSRAGLRIHPGEAAAVAEMFQLVADGGSVRAATRLLRDRGHTGATGRPFTPETVRRVLTNPRHAGLVAHQGKVVGEAADQQAIVAVEVWHTVQARLSDPSRRTTPGRPAGTPLSGIASCGKCGGPMNASNKWNSRGGSKPTPVYICSRHQHLTRRRALVDEPVLTSVGSFLVEKADALTAQVAPATAGVEAGAAREVQALTDRLAALSDLAAAGELDPADYAATARSVRARLVDAQARAVAVAGRPATARLLASDDVAAHWQALVDAPDVEPLRAVLREMLDSVVVVPGAQGFDGFEVRWSAPFGSVD
jgi:DNA invertase Pin-like site-specific DNA recombinase